jgi:two-component system, OmpR family, response regulator
MLSSPCGPIGASRLLGKGVAVPQILFVEDDEEIGGLVSRYLGDNSFEVTVVSDGDLMNDAINRGNFDMLLLDVGLKGEDGFSICRRVRSSSHLPIIMVTAKGDDVDKIVGLECGADDYVVKPFNPRELLARVRSLFRRIEIDFDRGERPEKRYFKFKHWVVDTASRRVKAPSGSYLILTTGEFDLLCAMCARPNEILSRDTLLSMTHGAVEGPFDRSVDILVSRLRAKFSNVEGSWDFIRTIRGEGYVFTAKVVQE